MTSFSDKVIKDFKSKANEDKKFVTLLEKSLHDAANAAIGQNLDKYLREALSWPKDLHGYIVYLTEFARWIPKQASAPPWNQQGDESREVLDRLCHFYWLIDQELEGGTIVENIDWFSDWLVDYADAWGSFLDTTESFNHDTLKSFIKFSKKYEVKNSMIGTEPDWRPNAPSGWLTFNQFFARRLNPGLRPIEQPGTNKIVTSPADCTFKARYDIDEKSVINIPPDVKIKNTIVTTVEQLLDGTTYKDTFANGIFAHYFLSPYSYHHFHMPVAGVVEECRSVQGRVYLDVKIKDGQFDAPDKSEGGYEFAQSRGILVINTAKSNKGPDYGDIGLVAVIPVGMAQVSSVNMTATKDQYLLKGDEFGYFLFGGSNIIVLFQNQEKKKLKLKLAEKTPPDYHRYGNKIAEWEPS
jgi:phosphatidylserine decarboxylase